MSEEREDIRPSATATEAADTEVVNDDSVANEAESGDVQVGAEVDAEKSGDANERHKTEIMDFLGDLFGLVGQGEKANKVRRASTDIQLDLSIRELNEEIARKREERRQRLEEQMETKSEN